MIVNQGRQTAELLEQQAYPIGTWLEFSDLDITDSKGQYRTMKKGILAGYDDFGGRPHVILQARDEENLPTGQPRVFSLSTLPNFVEIIEIDIDAEQV
jgi:hypothetical protein